jgi:hypothetical protein
MLSVRKMMRRRRPWKRKFFHIAYVYDTLPGVQGCFRYLILN